MYYYVNMNDLLCKSTSGLCGSHLIFHIVGNLLCQVIVQLTALWIYL